MLAACGRTISAEAWARVLFPRRRGTLDATASINRAIAIVLAVEARAGSDVTRRSSSLGSSASVANEASHAVQLQ
jgi:hypothetical protein